MRVTPEDRQPEARSLKSHPPNGLRGWETIDMTHLTTSEARAEAATVVLKLMLKMLTPKQRKKLKARARAAGADIGLPAIEEEISWLFWK
jgi:hypothetical protein